MYMHFKIAPEIPMTPFDFYSIKANNKFEVQWISARAKVSSEECEGELKKIAHQIEGRLNLTLSETLDKNTLAFISENDDTLLSLSCGRYRKYQEKNLKDISVFLASKEKLPRSLEVDKEKSKRMHEIIKRNRIKKVEINLISNHDLSGEWSTNCSGNNSGISIKKIREYFYHFFLCSGFKCIHVPRITSDDVEIVNAKHLRVSGQNYKLCKTLDK